MFSHGNPTDLATLTDAVNGAALVGVTTYGDVECFAVTMAPDTSGAPAKLHALRNKLAAEGFSVRSQICAKVSSVLVQKRTESPHSPPTVLPVRGTDSARTAGGESTYEPADVDLTACECGGDCAHEIDDFKSFATCRCCTSCGSPDSVVFDVHAVTDDDSDVEPYCASCAVEKAGQMLAGGWPLGSFVLRWLPLSDRALRLAKAAA